MARLFQTFGDIGFKLRYSCWRYFGVHLVQLTAQTGIKNNLNHASAYMMLASRAKISRRILAGMPIHDKKTDTNSGPKIFIYLVAKDSLVASKSSLNVFFLLDTSEQEESSSNGSPLKLDDRQQDLLKKIMWDEEFDRSELEAPPTVITSDNSLSPYLTLFWNTPHSGLLFHCHPRYSLPGIIIYNLRPISINF